MKAKDIKANMIELEKFKEQNRKDRLWFIDYWVNYINAHEDEEWSKQQKVLIDSQIPVQIIDPAKAKKLTMKDIQAYKAFKNKKLKR